MAVIAKPVVVTDNVKYPNSASAFMKYKAVPVNYISTNRLNPCPYKSYGGTSSMAYVHPLFPNSVYTAHSNWAINTCINLQNVGFTSLYKAEALNRSYARFKEKLIALEAELGASLAERRQASDMIVARAANLRRAYMALRRGRFDLFVRELPFGKRPKVKSRWSRPRDASALWLEYNYGWKPLVQDIHSSILLLESPFPLGERVYASARVDYSHTLDATYEAQQGNFTFRCRHQADFYVSNPNLFRATQLGLTNPAAILWELVPFSFVVDWFLPVGNFLNSFSDFNGVTFQNPFTTIFYTFKGQHTSKSNVPSRPVNFAANLTAFHMQRTLGLSKPVVYPKVFRGFSVTRAANAISVLISTLKP